MLGYSETEEIGTAMETIRTHMRYGAVNHLEELGRPLRGVL